MNLASAFVWLMGAGALGIAALPRPPQPPPRADDAGAALTNAARRELEDQRDRRLVRVILASPYERRGAVDPNRITQVDTLTVGALAEARAPARVKAAPRHPTQAAPAAPKARVAAQKKGSQRHAKARLPARKSFEKPVAWRTGPANDAPWWATASAMEPRP